MSAIIFSPKFEFLIFFISGSPQTLEEAGYIVAYCDTGENILWNYWLSTHSLPLQIGTLKKPISLQPQKLCFKIYQQKLSLFQIPFWYFPQFPSPHLLSKFALSQSDWAVSRWSRMGFQSFFARPPKFTAMKPWTEKSP